MLCGNRKTRVRRAGENPRGFQTFGRRKDGNGLETVNNEFICGGMSWAGPARSMARFRESLGFKKGPINKWAERG